MSGAAKASSQVDSPLVSVVVPCFNHERWVAQCMRSVGELAYPRVELLVLDDGSIDGSFLVAKELEGELLEKLERVWVGRQANQGINKTLNTLVSKAHGDFIVPLASDDVLTKNGVAHAVSTLSREENEGCLLLVNIKLIDEDGKFVDRRTRIDRLKKDLRAEALLREIIFNWVTPYQHQVYSRGAFLAVGGYDESLKYEDLDFALRFGAKGRLIMTRVKVKNYRIRSGGSLTPGLSVHELDRSIVYWKSLGSVRGFPKALMYIQVLKYKSRVASLTCRILAMFHNCFVIGRP